MEHPSTGIRTGTTRRFIAVTPLCGASWPSLNRSTFSPWSLRSLLPPLALAAHVPRTTRPGVYSYSGVQSGQPILYEQHKLGFADSPSDRKRYTRVVFSNPTVSTILGILVPVWKRFGVDGGETPCFLHGLCGFQRRRTVARSPSDLREMP